MTLDNMTGITKGSYTGGDLFCKSQLITCNRVKECNGVCPFEDALKHADQAVKAIKSLPYAEPMTGWIPVSERLPDFGDTFLVTVMVGTKIETDVADSFGSYIDGFWDTFNDWIEDEECHVIAWMPLPEPYKDGDSDG